MAKQSDATDIRKKESHSSKIAGRTDGPGRDAAYVSTRYGLGGLRAEELFRQTTDITPELAL